MKLSQVQVKLLSDPTIAGLETAINSFLQGSGERAFVGIQWMAREYDSAPYTVMILYTE